MVMMLLAIGFVLLHAALVLSLSAHAMMVSYAFLVAAPLLACALASRKAWLTNTALSNGWSLVALSMLLWTLGMISSLREDIFLSNNNQVPGESMLLYMLYGIPVFYAVATIDVNETRVQRAIDAVSVASLGYLYYALMFSLTTLRGATNPHSAQMIVGMFDAENTFLAITTSIRFFAADTLDRRQLFGSMAAFTCLYAGAAAYYNHHIALDLGIDVGSAYDILIDVPFLAFAVVASRTPSKTSRPPSPNIGLVRFVRSGSPLLLALAVLLIALILLRQRFALGVAGIIVAVLGYGLRSILSQVHQIKTEDELRNDRIALTRLAMRDSLTGLANRRAFEETLEREWRLAFRAQHAISLLLIDVDFFKQYNDRYGHLAGDACLRRVAEALQQIAQRPADTLARYGGEEFALILPDTLPQGARDIAVRLCEAVRSIDMEHETSPTGHVTISIGMASCIPTSHGIPHELVAAADRALYEAKRNGRNRVEQTDPNAA